MRVTFLMPSYVWAPSGGYRVVCEYANRLAERGHNVTLVHPRRLRYVPPEELTTYRWVRREILRARELFCEPHTTWQEIDKRVNLLFVPDSEARHIPDGDVIFATAWHTVASVIGCPSSKGEKCYFIQHYEIWQGPKELVDASWQAPLHKVVIAKWLKELGEEMECEDLTYIPNAVNHRVHKVIRPIEDRPKKIAMMFSAEQFKGSADGIRALQIARQQSPNVKAVLFSTSRRQTSVPEWVEYYRNPPQDFIVNEILNGSSIFLCPSLSEGWGLPGAEASACGCAVVSTDNGGAREYLEHGVTGLLSPPGNADLLAENLCLLLRNDGLRIRLAKAANSYVSRLRWERSTDLLEHFLRAVTSTFAQAPQLSS